MKDPYLLVGRFLDSWYKRVDAIVWTANQRGTNLETVRSSQMLFLVLLNSYEAMSLCVFNLFNFR